jgi:cation:H+ antiporter
MKRRHVIAMSAAALAALPGMWMRLAGWGVSPQLEAAAAGSAIIGASFLLLWACDAAQTEMSQALALAVVALIAVLPEYSVDMYFTWQAGKNPAGDYAQCAIANMTGANRLLIGIAWGLIAALYWLRFRKPVRIEGERRTELFFLGLATLYAFLIPLKGTLAWYDGLVFLGVYAWYIAVAGKRPAGESRAEGPAEMLARLPKAARRLAIVAMFLFAGAVILANAEPFCEGLVRTGKALGINEFLLVQWLAPVASETPEFVVALMFAWRGEAGLALGSLLSAKLNQWTLLVGMIPGAFGLAHGSFAHPIPMGHFQMSELLLTAAQSMLAVVLLASMRLSTGGALLLSGMFAGQFILPVFSQWFPGLAFGLGSRQIHPVFSVMYVAVAAALFLQRPKDTTALVRGINRDCGCDGAEPDRPECERCKWRFAAEKADEEPAEERRPESKDQAARASQYSSNSPFT